MSMMVKFEQLAAQYLRESLRPLEDGDAIPESEARRQLLSAFELFLPLMLREADANHWRLEAFDAFQFPFAQRIGMLEAEFRGAGLLLAAETWTPVQVRLRAAEDSDTIAWARCQTGLRTPIPRLSELLISVCEHPERLDWAYSAAYPAAAGAV